MCRNKISVTCTWNPGNKYVHNFIVLCICPPVKVNIIYYQMSSLYCAFLIYPEPGQHVTIYDCKIKRDEISIKYLGLAIECLHTTDSTIVKVCRDIFICVIIQLYLHLRSTKIYTLKHLCYTQDQTWPHD